MLPRFSEAEPYATPQKLSGTKAKGSAYEKRVGVILQRKAKELGWKLYDHPWLETDRGFRQPDFLLVSPSSCVVVAECKLTWLDCSAQLLLYSRVLSEMGLKPVPLLVCRNLTPAAPAPIHEFEELEAWSVWHLWI